VKEFIENDEQPAKVIPPAAIAMTRRMIDPSLPDHDPMG
jgi:hypothetical protein